MILAPGIEAAPDICGGRPRFAGTRLPIEVVAGIAEGVYGIEEAIAAYPQITRDQVLLAIAFMAGMKWAKQKSR